MLDNESMITRRNRDLQDAYRRFIRLGSVNMRYIRRQYLIRHLINQPAPRFYICPKVAERYVLGYLKGRRKTLHSSKIEMIEDLVGVYRSIVSSGEALRQYEVWERVVESPARKFYITPERAEEILFNHNRHRYAKVRK